MESKIYGFIGAPGVWKTVAMNIVENEKNLSELSAILWKELTVDVVKKSTSRPNRGADDRLKISWVPEEDFIVNADNYVWEYTLTNNNSKYAYSKDELNKEADILVAEPSIHHLSVMKAHLKDRLVVILIAADTEYRKVRMNGRWTEEVSQVNKRVIEWDVQLFIASKLSWVEWERLVNLIDQEGYNIYEEIFLASDTEDVLKNKMTSYFMWLVWEEKFSSEATEEYFKMIQNNTKWDSEKLFDHIIIRTLEKDELAWNDFLVQWDFRDSIINAIYKESLDKKVTIPWFQKVFEKASENNQTQ